MDDDPELFQRYIDLKPPFLAKHPFGPVTQECIMRNIVEGSYFGFILADLEIPPERRPFFDIMPPIFATHSLSYDDWPEVMKKKAKEQNIPTCNRRLLMSGFQAKELLINDELARYYMQIGVRITKIHQCIEFTPREPFKQFAEDVTANRLAASRGQDRQIVGELFKLIGERLLDNRRFQLTIIIKSSLTYLIIFYLFFLFLLLR